MQRLQKIIAEAGVASRRAAEEMILAGRVKVNGRVVRELGTKADPETDQIRIGNKVLSTEKKVYIKLNKPVGYISSNSGEQGQNVLKLVKVKERIYPVGRLDKESEGLMILTNDGEYALQMMHPRFEHEKEYLVGISRAMTPEDFERIASGPQIDGEKMRPMKIRAASEDGLTVSMVLKEGKKRQIRRVMQKFGYHVNSLKRVRIGRELLGNLAPGKWEFFTPETF